MQSSATDVDQTDQEIIARTLSRDKDSFAIIVNRYQRPILIYLLRLLNYNQSDAEDVLAETFLKVYLNLGGYNPTLKFSSWLYRIAHNEAVNLIRKKSKYFIVDINTLGLSQDFNFEKSQTLDLEKILTALPADDRNVLVLFYLEDMSHREIAEILKTSENNVAVKLNRARKKAKKILSQQTLPI